MSQTARAQFQLLLGSIRSVASVAGDLLLPTLTKGVEYVGELVNRFMALSPATQAFLVVGTAIAGVLATIAGGFILLAPAIAALPAAFAGVGTVAGIIAGILGGPVTLAIAAVVAAVGLLAAAWQNDFGGIQGIVASVWGYIQGVFTSIVDWLQVAIPTAGAAAAGFWTDTLLPAIQTVGRFLGATIIPLFQSVGNVLTSVVGVAITALAGLWENVLAPAIQVATAILTAQFAPALAFLTDTALPALRAFLNNVIAPAFDYLGNVVFSGLILWIDDLVSKFQAVTGFFNDVAGIVAGIQLPSFLTPATGNTAAGISTASLPSPSEARAQVAPNMGVNIILNQDREGNLTATTEQQRGIGNLKVALATAASRRGV